MRLRKRLSIAAVSVGLSLVVSIPRLIYAGDTDLGSTGIVGIGGAYAGMVEDAGSLWLNPACVDQHRVGGVSIGYRQLWGLSDLEEISTTARRHLGKRLSVGAGFDRFGNVGLYQEYDAMGTLSYELAHGWNAGLGVHYLRTEFGDNEVAVSGSFADVGALANLSSSLTAGMAVRRIPLDGLYGEDADDPGALYELSGAWRIPGELSLAAIWTHESDGDNRFGIGQRMEFGEIAEFLAGLRFDPVRYTLGGQVHYRGGGIQYVYLSHSDLGGTHTVGLTWGW